MAHTMHLASKAFIEEICPTPSRYKRKRAPKPPDTGLDDDEYDLDEEDN